MSRGHLVTMWGGGVVDPFVAEEFEDYDGCLLLGTEPELIEIADIFETKSKKVWRQLGDIPRERDRPQAEYWSRQIKDRGCPTRDPWRNDRGSHLHQIAGTNCGSAVS